MASASGCCLPGQSAQLADVLQSGPVAGHAAGPCHAAMLAASWLAGLQPDSHLRSPAQELLSVTVSLATHTSG